MTYWINRFGSLTYRNSDKSWKQEWHDESFVDKTERLHRFIDEASHRLCRDMEAALPSREEQAGTLEKLIERSAFKSTNP